MMLRARWFSRWRGQNAVFRTRGVGRPRIVYYEVHAQRHLVDTMAIGPKHFGLLLREIDEACLDGDVAFVSQFRWIRHIRFARVGRGAIPREIARAVWARDEGKCVDCHSNDEIQYDHVLAVVHGGETTVENLQLRCRRCNRLKGPRPWERRRLSGVGA